MSMLKDRFAEIPPIPGHQSARPHLAVEDHHRGADLVQFRPARRQPSLIEPMDAAKKMRFFKTGAGRPEADRSGLPVGFRYRLQLRPRVDRRQPHPGRRHHPGADPGPRRPDHPHLRIPARAKKAIVHVYNATAPSFRRIVFNQDKQGVVDIATNAAKLIKLAAEQPDTSGRSSTRRKSSAHRAGFSVEVCN